MGSFSVAAAAAFPQLELEFLAAHSPSGEAADAVLAGPHETECAPQSAKVSER
jgi:hypothetical protein